MNALAVTVYIFLCLVGRVCDAELTFLFVLNDFQDDTAFEKQSALFALAIADVVLINM